MVIQVDIRRTVALGGRCLCMMRISSHGSWFIFLLIYDYRGGFMGVFPEIDFPEIENVCRK